jgi:NADPH2:quinone reductase
LLAQTGSLFLTRPVLMHYTATPAELSETAKELFEVLRNGWVHIRIEQTYPLREAAQAHRELEARRTSGSSLLLP